MTRNRAELPISVVDPLAVDIVRFAITGEARVPVRSSAIATTSYQLPFGEFGAAATVIGELTGTPMRSTLTVEFADGDTAEYPRISPRDFADFLAAPPIGRFYNSVVRGRWG